MELIISQRVVKVVFWNLSSAVGNKLCDLSSGLFVLLDMNVEHTLLVLFDVVGHELPLLQDKSFSNKLNYRSICTIRVSPDCDMQKCRFAYSYNYFF